MPYEKRWTGDRGETNLRMGKTTKHSLRIEAIGSIDELNAFIGIALVDCGDSQSSAFLEDIQEDLFEIGADLAAPLYEKVGRVHAKRNEELEDSIKRIDEHLEDLKNFVLPGGTKCAAALHVCRTVCRRAERRLVALQEHEPVNPELLKYLNRLGDVLFQLARLQNKRTGMKERIWKGK